MTQTGMGLGAGVVLFLTVVIPGCRPNPPQQVRLERRWSPGVYLCEARDQADLESAMSADGEGPRRQTRTTTTELAELTVGEADSSGAKRLEWRPRRMVVVRDGAVCDSESESATPTCFVPRAMVKTVYAGHVNPDGTAADDGLAADDDGPAQMWTAFRSWTTSEAEWHVMMGDLRRVLTVNFGPLDPLPRAVSAGDTWVSTSKASAPAFPGVVAEIRYQHEVERIEGAPGGPLVTIVSTSSGGLSGTRLARGEVSANVKSAGIRSVAIFDVSLGMVTASNKSASGELDVEIGRGLTRTFKYRYESSTTCRHAGK